MIINRVKAIIFLVAIVTLLPPLELQGQNAIYWQKVPIISQPKAGTGFARFEQRLSSVLNQVLSHLNTPTATLGVNQIAGNLNQLQIELQNMMQDPNGPDQLTSHYYLGLIHYGLWLLDTQHTQHYQNALAQFTSVVQNNDPAGLGDLALYYYSSMYLKGVLPLQKYWLLSENSSTADIRMGIQNLHTAINTFNGGGVQAVHLLQSSKILIAWAEIEYCYLNPKLAQLTVNLNDAESMLSGDFGSDPRLTQIKFYFLAIIKYIRSVMATDEDFDSLLSDVTQILNDKAFNGNQFPSTFTDALLWARFMTVLRKDLASTVAITLPPFDNDSFSLVARFYMNMITQGFRNCNFVPLNTIKINIPEINFFQILGRFFSVVKNYGDPSAAAQITRIRKDLSAFIAHNANSPINTYANFFLWEIRFYESVINGQPIPVITIPGNLPANLRSVLEDRNLLRRFMQIPNINQAGVDWRNPADAFVIILSPTINQLNFQFTDDELFRPSSPVSTLFSLASRDHSYYAPLINLLGYLWRNCPDATVKKKLSLLSGWAIFRSNPEEDHATATLALQWLNIVSDNASVNAERDLIKANIYYYGLTDHDRACNILLGTADNRAQELINAWHCPANPPTLSTYDFIGFEYKDIEDPSIIFCGYDMHYFNAANIHYSCYRDILKGIFLNHPYNPVLFSLYPPPFLRFALHSSNGGFKYIRDISLMNYLASGVNVGQKIPVTFHFPGNGAEFSIPGEFPRSTVPTNTEQVNLNRFTSYRIECALPKYYKYANTFIFTRTTDVRLDTLMVAEENWHSPKEYSLPASLTANGPSYFFDLDVNEESKILVYLSAVQGRYYLGMQRNEITDIRPDLLSIYAIPDGIRPVAIAMDGNKKIYIADAQTNSIWTTNIQELKEQYKLESLKLIARSVKKSPDIFVFHDFLYVANAANGEVVGLNINDYGKFKTIFQGSGKVEIVSRTPQNFYLGSWEKLQSVASYPSCELSNVWGVKPYISNEDYFYVGDVLTSSLKIFNPSGEEVSSYKLSEMDFPIVVYKTESTGFVAGKDKILVYHLKDD